MNNEKEILTRLAKILADQQKALRKLAQFAPAQQVRDPNIDYITQKLVPIVAMNLSLKGAVATVSMIQPGHYTANVSGVPQAQRKAFISHVDAMLEKQKPELAGQVNISFTD